jgi:acetate kinase
MAERYALVLNAGSSSLKFSLFSPDAGEWRLQSRGQVEGIGSSPKFSAKDAEGRLLAEGVLANQATNRDALNAVAEWLRTTYRGSQVLGAGHRVVHGGVRYDRPTRITPQVLEDLRALIPLAPLHEPYNLAAIEEIASLLPGIEQAACFDTSFHRGQPEVAQVVPLPEEIRRRGVQRYGFHGLSYEYIASALPRIAPELAGGRVIAAHLGNGASMCAMKAGKSRDSTFGFTALDGLCMGTRPGSLDPGVVLYLFQNRRMSAGEVEAMLYRQSGLLALSGISNDMRDLLASSRSEARLAVDYFIYRAAKEIGALAAVLGGVDGLVFTAGIGENSAEIRRRICEASAWLGLELDHEANLRGGPRITSGSSKISAWVVPTNEELMIVRHTSAVLGLSADGKPGVVL